MVGSEHCVALALATLPLLAPLKCQCSAGVEVTA